MAPSPKLDLFDLWRQALSKLETGMNAQSNRSMNSDEFTRTLQTLSASTLGMQPLLEKALRKHLKMLNLPTRDDTDALFAALQRIEERLDALLPPQPVPSVAKPARTRRPPEASADVAPPRARRVAAAPRRTDAAR